MKKGSFYSLDKIKKHNAEYNMIIGERSNGKTYAVKMEILKKHAASKCHDQAALIRRWDEDFKGIRGTNMFSDIVENGELQKLFGDRYDGIMYFRHAWYLSKKDENGKTVKAEEPFCYAFAVTAMEHDKSTSYPKITTVLFDEVITRKQYVPDEFILFMNCLSTIIRERDNVTIYMLGNTVSHFSPYYTEMGLKHVRQMKQGDIDLYTYGDSGCKVAVEYIGESKFLKKSNKYFAFDNPKLNMIKTGAYELDVHPHLTKRFKRSEIMFIYFIIYEEFLLQCEVVQSDGEVFTYIHEKTTELKDIENDLIYTTDVTSKPNYRVGIIKARDKIGEKVAFFFKQNLVFYQNNEIGEIVSNYIKDTDGVII